MFIISPYTEHTLKVGCRPFIVRADNRVQRYKHSQRSYNYLKNVKVFDTLDEALNSLPADIRNEVKYYDLRNHDYLWEEACKCNNYKYFNRIDRSIDYRLNNLKFD